MLLAPFPYFGGKRSVADAVWKRFGTPKQYIEPFCGSAAMLLAAPKPALLEVVCDMNGFIANFWRAVKHQPERVAEWADYPVSHIDLGARHIWLRDQIARLADELMDAHWPGDAQVAGWWLWGQSAWIGSGWCEWKIPHTSDAGKGVHAVGKIPNTSNAGMGVHAVGKIPHTSDAGRLLTSGGRTAWAWLRKLSDRLERVRIIHGDWNRCLNSSYGKNNTAIFLDPPYEKFESVYGKQKAVAQEVAEWARENAHIRIALCGHSESYELDGWNILKWSRGRNTYGSVKTRDAECVWFSPACLKVDAEQMEIAVV